MTTDEIAQLAHEANRAYRGLIGEDPGPDWLTAPDWQKESAIAGVLAVQNKPSIGPEASHRRWMERKQGEGWVHGPVKDETKRTHPCICPWDELPVEQRRKDVLFLAVVRAGLWGNAATSSPGEPTGE